MENYHLWPSNLKVLPDNIIQFFSIRERDVERLLAARYPSFESVVFPSGRSALYNIILALGLGRNDKVLFPEYSSRCVVDAISFIATPTLRYSRPGAILVYHQWGFKQQFTSRPPDSIPVIEDSCDSFIVSEKELFPNNGFCELFSCSKIFGTLTGGFVVCRDRDFAQELRRIKQKNRWTLAINQYFLKVLHNWFHDKNMQSVFYEYYCGVEAKNRTLTPFILAPIADAIRAMDRTAAKRKLLLEKIRKRKISFYKQENIAGQRLPSNLPLQIRSPETISRFKQAGFITDIRNFNTGTYDTPVWKKCIPLPVHQFVEEGRILDVIALL
ncbi:putative PLP-dependent aminotransferase [Thermodesulfobacteriota bacterium]